MATPLWAWGATCAAIAGLVAGDMALGARSRDVGVRGAVRSSLGWIAVAVGFGALIGVTRGSTAATQYYSGYLLEKSLSIDNVFAFALILTNFKIPLGLQRRVLQWGVIGALLLRAGFIALGTALVEDVSWSLSLFGAFVVLAGIRMAWGGGEPRPERGFTLRALRRLVPITDALDGGRFLIRVDGRRYATPMLLAVVAVEATDAVLASDSIPAIFGVTTDAFLVFTSNAFAVLGLRALYLVLAAVIDRARFLARGLAVLLVVIGVKLLLHDVVTVPPALNLVIIAVVLGASALVGAAQARWRERDGQDRG